MWKALVLGRGIVAGLVRGVGSFLRGALIPPPFGVRLAVLVRNGCDDLWILNVLAVVYIVVLDRPGSEEGVCVI